MQNQHKTVPLNDGRPPWATNGTRKKKNEKEMKKNCGNNGWKRKTKKLNK